MTATMKAIQPAADAGLAVAVILHDRKSGGRAVSAMRGSNAVAAAVDFILSIRPATKGQSSVRVLRFTGRGLEAAEPESHVELTKSGYTVTSLRGDQRERQRRQPLRTTKLRMPADAEGAVSLAQLAARSRLPEGPCGRS